MAPELVERLWRNVAAVMDNAGYVVVPRELTPALIAAATEALGYYDQNLVVGWRAICAAAAAGK